MDDVANRRKSADGTSTLVASVQLEPVDANKIADRAQCVSVAYAPPVDFAEPKDTFDSSCDYTQLLADLLERAFDKSFDPALESDPRYRCFAGFVKLSIPETSRSIEKIHPELSHAPVFCKI